MTLDWDTLRVVLAVSKEGSISGAARKLGVNIATISRQIGRAEEALEAKLFDRRHNGLFPTEQGLAAIDTAQAMQDEVEGLQGNVEGSILSEEGLIRLSLPLNVMQFGFADHLIAFQKLYPKIRFQINATDSPIDFESREADVVLRVGENPPASLWGFKIATVDVSFYGSTEFMAKWGDEIRDNPREAKVPFIELYTANPAADRDEFLAHFPNAIKCASCNGMDSLIPMLRNGIGAGRVMRYMARSYPELELIFDCSDSWSRTVWILTHRDYRSTHRVRIFLEFIRDRFKKRNFEF